MNCLGNSKFEFNDKLYTWCILNELGLRPTGFESLIYKMG